MLSPCRPEARVRRAVLAEPLSAAPHAVPEAAPHAVPEAEPHAVPEAAPHAVPEAAPAFEPATDRGRSCEVLLDFGG
ncbi:hypothetical protein [Streptomyces zinciresistens]|uniref:hypothetical protein n=1 Tax=Streptomyces zinciresistens TaxID=1073330 RepID=UPI001112061F|nr:hypothetical protein [Streptomyces zinciresistens]